MKKKTGSKYNYGIKFYMKLNHIPILLMGIFLSLISINAQYQFEEINRGVVAVKNGVDGIYVGWRLLANDTDTLGFNLYRITTDIGTEKLNDEPLKGATNFYDTTAVLDSTNYYYVVPVIAGVEQESSDTAIVWNTNYKNIPLQIPPPGTTPEGSYTYSANDASVGDLDGDGDYDIVLKWDPSNSHDNAHNGYTGNCILDGYNLEGDLLWRIDLGINIRAGAHYTQFMVYDLDGDGVAEIACKTAPGTKDGTGNYISTGPADSANHIADHRNSSGHVLEGPEYLTIFEGRNGQEIITTYYNPPRHPDTEYPSGAQLSSVWGDGGGNRSDRYLAAIAYLDGERPSLVMCRGYYSRTVLAAWDFRNDTLSQRWVFDTDVAYSSYAGQGNHGISVADVDDDGRDEIIYGAMAVDDDGTGLWNTGLGHGDAMHVTDIIPDRDGLEKWGIHEGSGPGSALLDARTGEILWITGNADVGRGVAADVYAGSYGMECWGGTDGLRTAKGNVKVGNSPSSANHVVWWDGDLVRELLDGISINKHLGGVLLTASGCASNNGTKSNPALQADILGDWREEVFWRTSASDYLRVYTTKIVTDYRIKTLMHDPVYRLGVVWQNVGYNQPPHTSFYLGEGMFDPDSTRPPSRPTGLEQRSTSEFIQLEWNANVESDLAGYNIYRSDTVDGNYQILNDSLLSDFVYQDSTVAIDIFYYYVLTAIDTLGNESIYSETIQGVSTLNPDWPFEVRGNPGRSGAYIYWQENTASNIVGYNIYRSTTLGSDYVKVNTSAFPEAHYADVGLSNNVTYYYVVTCVDDEDRESFFSDETSVTPVVYVTLQAEDQIVTNAWVEDEHLGYFGTGYVNFDGTGSVEFNGVFGYGGGWYKVITRHALGNSNRTGRIVVNDSIYPFTMDGTGEWTNYIYDTVILKLNASFDNVVRFEATGSDFGNLDQIKIYGATQPPTAILSPEYLTNKETIKIYPNPFRDEINISVSVNQPAEVDIYIYNQLGQLVNELAHNTIVHDSQKFQWNGKDLSGHEVDNGVYFCKIIFANESTVVKPIIFNR